MFTCRERVLSAAGDQLITREMTTHVERGVIADRFYAERLYDEDNMRALLTCSGFVVSGGPAQFASTSSRNQDLGMMAQRLIFVAQKM
jgi:D-alanine-D-alanine ligase